MPPWKAVIVVIGEALVDVVTGVDGSVSHALGGAPYNTSRAIARLGGDVEYVGSLSTDETGSRLVAQLEADGVGLHHAPRTDLPSTVARATIGEDGSATYRFELAGTSAPALTSSDFASLPEGPTLVFTGGLALVADPAAEAVTSYLESLPDETMVVIDLNCRPAAIADDEAYWAIVERVLARADVVKVSDEDIEVLRPGEEVIDVASRLAEGGVAVIVTAGADGCTLTTQQGRTHVAAAPLPGPIVDTIGAGDTFDGAFLDWLDNAHVTRTELPHTDLRPGLEVASRAAAVVVTRHGADPPARPEL